MLAALSVRHTKVQRLRRLIARRSARAAEAAFVVEGPTLLAEALAAGSAVESVYVAPGGYDGASGAAVTVAVVAAQHAGARIYDLGPGVLERIAGTVTPQPLLAVVPQIGRALDDLADSTLLVVCVDVRDPGNAGTVLRSAEAAGADGVVCCGGTVDIYNPKCVRASAGSLFHVPVVAGGDAVTVLEHIGAWGLQRLGTAIGKGSAYTEADLRTPTALVLGNEAHGLAAASVEGSIDGWVHIPMAGRGDSLNVGMACAVLCFEAAPGNAAAVRAMTDRLVDLLPDAVLRLDPAGRITDANAAAADLTGYPLDTLVGSVCADLLDPQNKEGQPLLGDGLHRSARLRSVRTIPEQEVLLLRADGAEVMAFVTGSYQRNGKGELKGATLVLREAGRRAHQTPTGMEIVSTVSHELRSPLTSVKGYTGLLLSRWERLADPQKKEMLEQVNHDADRVKRLIDELLDISRLETGRLHLRRQMVTLPDLVNNVLDKVRMEWPDLDVAVVFADEVPEVYADPDKLTQVLTNLVENACKYGSVVGMSVGAEVVASEVSVSVTDTGEGIPAADLPKVFNKFFRRDMGRPTGSGLGLWISRGLVEAHGGRLTATSIPGKGTTFRFTLPLFAFEELHGS